MAAPAPLVHSQSPGCGRFHDVTKTTTGRHTIVLDEIEVIVHPERDDVHPALVPLHDFWRLECGGALPLPRKMIDPVRLPAKILPGFAILEVLRKPTDFRYRLLGTNLTQFFGRDSTGELFSEIAYPEPQGARLKRYFELVCDRNVMVHRTTTADWANRDYLTIASMFIPGTSDGKTTDFIFGAVVTIK